MHLQRGIKEEREERQKEDERYRCRERAHCYKYKNKKTFAPKCTSQMVEPVRTNDTKHRRAVVYAGLSNETVRP